MTTKITLVIILTIVSVFYWEKNSLQANPHFERAEWHINTSNQNKLKEFQNLFAQYNISLLSTQIDLHEIDSTPASVVAHKASQLEELILVEDTSLDIEGAFVGINVRWLIDHLEEYIGKKATWRVLLAYRVADRVFIFKGEVHGSIVAASGEQGFGFDPVFLPENCSET